MNQWTFIRIYLYIPQSKASQVSMDWWIINGFILLGVNSLNLYKGSKMQKHLIEMIRIILHFVSSPKGHQMKSPPTPLSGQCEIFTFKLYTRVNKSYFYTWKFQNACHQPPLHDIVLPLNITHNIKHWPVCDISKISACFLSKKINEASDNSSAVALLKTIQWDYIRLTNPIISVTPTPLSIIITLYRNLFRWW